MAAVRDRGAGPPAMGFGLLWGGTRCFWGEFAPKIRDWACDHPFQHPAWTQAAGQQAPRVLLANRRCHNMSTPRWCLEPPRPSLPWGVGPAPPASSLLGCFMGAGAVARCPSSCFDVRGAASAGENLPVSSGERPLHRRELPRMAGEAVEHSPEPCWMLSQPLITSVSTRANDLGNYTQSGRAGGPPPGSPRAGAPAGGRTPARRAADKRWGRAQRDPCRQLLSPP